MWLKVAESTSDPSYVAHYYLNAVDDLRGYPILFIIILIIYD